MTTEGTVGKKNQNSSSRDELAILGGKPVRAKPIAPLVEVSSNCKKRIIDLLELGSLSNWYGGPVSREFEQVFADYHGVSYGVAVNSGTSALHVAYVAAGIRPGDEVIVPSVGYLSAASAAIQEGALPIICDVEPQTLGISTNDLEKRITPRTKLIVPVHLWGIPNDMDSIMAVSQRHGIPVLEDCGQAHGAKYKGQLVGTFGEMAAFSFAPRKHISTGQGGMVLFRNAEYANKARSAANKGKGHGWHDYYRLGYSYVMGDMEALVGIDGLKNLEAEVEKRRRAARIYESYLADSGLEMQSIPEKRYACYFKYPFRLPTDFLPYKKFMIGALLAENISTRASHPPMHKIPWLAEYIRKHGQDNPAASAPRPVAEREVVRIVEAETGPAMSDEDVHISAKGVLKVWNRIKEMYKQGVVPEFTGETDLCT
jgi:perosamine synthetase